MSATLNVAYFSRQFDFGLFWICMLRHKQSAKLYFVTIFNTIFIGNVLGNLVAIFHGRICEAGKKPKRMHRICYIPLLSDPVHYAGAQYLNRL